LRFCLFILLLLSSTIFSQSKTWIELKESIKKESAKDKQGVIDIQQKKKLPVSFSDDRNHFLMRAVHPSGKPIYLTTLNAEAAITSSASLIQNGVTGFLLTGVNQHIFEWDAGLVKQHVEFGNRVIANEGTLIDNHATHVAGTLMAAGANAQAKGMSPNAFLHAYYFDNDIEEMASQAELSPYGFYLSNHSYGTSTGWNKSGGIWTWHGDDQVSNDEDYTAGNYTTRTKQIDEIAYLAPYYAIVWAAGNDRGDIGTGGHPADCNGGTGYDCIIQEGTAKNIITVGAVNKVLNYTAPASVAMSNFSSWGPTDDGRIKPDLVGAGVGLFSASSNGIDTYTTLSGTSMATPNVAGSLVLLQELYGKLNGEGAMKASTLKALAIHTAKEAGAGPGPDYNFGWGLIDVAEGARLISKTDNENIFILERELSNGGTHEWLLQPQANKKITVTLVWADPAGLPPGAVLDPTNSMLVNDLDVRLTDDSGVKKFPWILDPGSPGSPGSQATQGDNIRDNIEKIEFDFPEAKPYQLQVSHKGYLVNNVQPYSLIISYTSQNTTKIFYWVGGSGNWNDPAHWSLTSGGASAGIIPAQSDRIIVDENSFSGAGNILLTGNAKCKSLRWWLNKPVGIDFNGKNLEISNELTFASNGFQKIGDGRFVLNAPDSGMVNGYSELQQRPDLQFVSGNWTMSGNIYTDSLIFSGGDVSIKNSKLFINNFIGQTSSAKLDVDNSIIRLNESWTSDASKIEITSNYSEIKIESDTVVFQANNLAWTGTLSIINSKVNVTGTLMLDSLFTGPASTIQLSSGGLITVENGFDAQGIQGMPVVLEGIGPASMNFNFHKKLCLDYMQVNLVNLTGQGIVNLGTNSTIQNSSGWLQQGCDQVLFPDFDVRYNCQNALAQFTNNSTGPIESYQWNFGDDDSNQNLSDMESPTHQFNNTGVFSVTLTVSGGGKSVVYTKPVSIVANTLPESEIEYNSEMMFSSVEAPYYQWLEGRLLLPQETNRTLSYQGVEGLYQLVIYDEQCNHPSSELLITDFENIETSWAVYPNPANDRLYFSFHDAEEIIIKDCLSRSYDVPWNSSEGWAEVSSLNDGLYILLIKKDGKEWMRRILVRR